MCADFDLQILASLNSGFSYNPDRTHSVSVVTISD